MFLILFGLGAGALTTVAGLGGGQLLILTLSLIWDPRQALVTTAPALLVGNLHRLWLYRRALDRRLAMAIVAGALPGALAGGLLAVALPLWVIDALMLGTAGLAIARACGIWELRPPRIALAPVGIAIGMISATSTGAALITGPVLMAAGLSGTAYVATSACIAAAMHAGRLSGYGLGGLVDPEMLMRAAALSAAVLAGNFAGDRSRRYLTPGAGRAIEIAAMVACMAIAVLGLGRRAV